MKTKMGYFSYMLMFTLLTSTMYAQTTGNEEGEPQNELLTTKTLNVAYYPRTVSWWDSGNGFIRKHTVDTVCYITRFNKQGDYIETLIKRTWDNRSALHPSFQLSQYSLQTVTGYWEVSDVNKKGYYLEMTNSNNEVSSVWADEYGKFSSMPAVNKSKQ
jgi:hypothetical protein